MFAIPVLMLYVELYIGPRTKNPNYGLDEAGPSHGRRCGRGGRGGGRVGGRGRRGVPHVPPPDDELMNEIRELDVIQEEQILVDELRNTPIPQQILEMGWERVVAPPTVANMSIVREFYHSIDIANYRKEGIMVRGVRVPFNEQVLNRFYGTTEFPTYRTGFPFTDDYVGPLPKSVVEELRMYPMTKVWKRSQRLDHRELSTDLAFWNDFISHTISPKAQYQKLRGDHHRIILAINRAERFDLGTVMCKSLDWHVTRRKYPKRNKQLVFPCTITTLCGRAGIDVTNQYEDYLKPIQPLGATTFASIAGSRAESGYIMDEDADVEVEEDDEDSEDESIGALLQKLSVGQKEIMNRLDGFGKSIGSLESCMLNIGSRVTGLEEIIRGVHGQGGAGHEGNLGNAEVNVNHGEDQNMDDQ